MSYCANGNSDGQAETQLPRPGKESRIPVRMSFELRQTRVLKKILFTIFVTTLALPLVAQTKTLLNLDKAGLAVQGYDPVAFFTGGKPVKGNRELGYHYNGATYYFASKEHREAFISEPGKYEPQFGGYCAYGVSRNKLVKIDVDAFQIVDGKLLLQYSKGVRDDFNKDQQGNLDKANANWPGLVEKKGK